MLDDYVETKYHKRDTPLPATTAPFPPEPVKPSLRVLA